MYTQSAAVIVTTPQALGRLGEQVLREIPGAVIRAQFWLQYMLMADALGEAGGGRLDIDAMQHLMEQHAIDAAPHPAQLERSGLPKLGDGENSGTVEPLLHAGADAVDLLQ